MYSTDYEKKFLYPSEQHTKFYIFLSLTIKFETLESTSESNDHTILKGMTK